MAAFVFLAALITATFVVTGRKDIAPAPPGRVAGHWSAQSSGITATLLDVDFVDSRNGWAVGEGGVVLHTSDGGETWERQESGTELSLLRVTFVSPREGWAVGKFGVIIHTSDGGLTWELQGADAALDLHLVGVSFADERTGWAATEMGSTVLATTDGGETWSRKPFGSASARSDMVFIDALRGWVALSQDGVLHTRDGGVTWEYQSGVRAGMNGMFFLDENNGWIAGWRGKDPGPRFTRFLSDGMVARTADGGKTWARHDSGTGQVLWDVAFVDAREGWAVGAFGTILYSEDGGITWTPQPGGTREMLRGVSFPDKNNGWAVGNNGTILKLSR